MIEQEKMLEILKKGLLFRNMEDDEIMEALETMGSAPQRLSQAYLSDAGRRRDDPGGHHPVGKPALIPYRCKWKQ